MDVDWDFWDESRRDATAFTSFRFHYNLIVTSHTSSSMGKASTTKNRSLKAPYEPPVSLHNDLVGLKLMEQPPSSLSLPEGHYWAPGLQQ